VPAIRAQVASIDLQPADFDVRHDVASAVRRHGRSYILTAILTTIGFVRAVPLGRRYLWTRLVLGGAAAQVRSVCAWRSARGRSGSCDDRRAHGETRGHGQRPGSGRGDRDLTFLAAGIPSSIRAIRELRGVILMILVVALMASYFPARPCRNHQSGDALRAE
jgi:hypothetical protein